MVTDTIINHIIIIFVNIIKDGDILEIFGRKFRINGCDVFTNQYYKEKYDVEFPVREIEKPLTKEYKSNKISKI